MKQKFIEKRFAGRNYQLITIINGILDEYARLGYDLSLRQLYYQLVARDQIENSQKSYKRIGELVTDARLCGLVDWQMITDRNRHTVGNQHWTSINQLLDAAANSWAINLWFDQPNHVEVMVEKDALSGVLEPVCSQLDVRFTANKGYPSASILYRMGKRLGHSYFDQGKKVYVIHLGDHDPSGIDMSRDLQERLRMFADYAPIEVRRVALNMNQIEELQPPENPAKETDSRYEAYRANYGESSWELDAIEPRRLAQIVTDVVVSLRDETIWNEAVEEQEAGRKRIKELVGTIQQ